jgi:hypothetical protein
MGVGSSADTLSHQACAGCHVTAEAYKRSRGKPLRPKPLQWYLTAPDTPLPPLAPNGNPWDLERCCDKCNLKTQRAVDKVVKKTAELEQRGQEEHAAAVQAAQAQAATRRVTRARAAAGPEPEPEPPPSLLHPWMSPILKRLTRSKENEQATRRELAQLQASAIDAGLLAHGMTLRSGAELQQEPATSLGMQST